MKVLLVEPHYYTKYPPLGLMKLASFHRSRANTVKLIRGIKEDINFVPDIIEVTTLLPMRGNQFMKLLIIIIRNFHMPVLILVEFMLH